MISLGGWGVRGMITYYILRAVGDKKYHKDDSVIYVQP